MTPRDAAEIAWRGCHLMGELHVLQGRKGFRLRQVLKHAIIGEAIGSEPDWDTIMAHFVAANDARPMGHPHRVKSRKIREAIRKVRSACRLVES